MQCLILKAAPGLAVFDFFRVLFALFFIVGLSGCELARVESRIAPGQKLPPASAKYYIEHLAGEDWGYDKMITEEFRSAGKKATYGALGMAPKGDYIVTYYDRWYWDMSPYLLELDLRILDPKDRTQIAWAKVRRTSMVRAEPRMMAREAIAALFDAPVKKTNQPVPSRIVPGQGLPYKNRTQQ